MHAEETFLVATKETPEGRAFYPSGYWGAGYLLDEASERKIKTFLRRYVWIMIVTMMPILPFMKQHPLLVLLGYVTAISALHYAILRHILRHRLRTSIRLTYDDMMNAYSERTSLEALAYRLYVGALLMLLFAIGSGFLFDVSGLEGRLYMVLGFGVAAYAGLRAYRVSRWARQGRCPS